jgi:hypothetical protein
MLTDYSQALGGRDVTIQLGQDPPIGSFPPWEAERLAPIDSGGNGAIHTGIPQRFDITSRRHVKYCYIHVTVPGTNPNSSVKLRAIAQHTVTHTFGAVICGQNKPPTYAQP